MTSADPVLLPNFGGEEGLDWRTLLQQPLYQRLALLWTDLFGSSAQLLEMDPNQWPVRFRDRAGDRQSLFQSITGGVPWLATPEACAQFDRLGIPTTGPGPVLARELNDKAFARPISDQACGERDLARGIYKVFDPAELEDENAFIQQLDQTIAGWPEWAQRRWTLKPRMGSSGRGRVPGVNRQTDTPEIVGSLPRFIRQGGVVVEPFFSRIQDYSLQAEILSPTEIKPWGSLRQELTTSGALIAHHGLWSEGVVSAGDEWASILHETGDGIIQQLADRGLRGMVGIDAFTYRLGERIGFRVSEINARFTVGQIAIGQLQRALHEIQPTEPVSFSFHLSLPENGTIADDQRLIGLTTEDGRPSSGLIIRRRPD